MAINNDEAAENGRDGSAPDNSDDALQVSGIAVGDEYEADVYFYSGPIADAGLGRITKEITRGKRRDNALLILTTNGGSANAAYQIARLFQKTYETFILCTPSYCKSAGTIIALGAHRIIMDVFSELGPLAGCGKIQRVRGIL